YRPLGTRGAPNNRDDPRSAASRPSTDPLSLERRVDLDPVRGAAGRRGSGASHESSGARRASPIPGRHLGVRGPLPVWRVPVLVEGRPARGQSFRYGRGGPPPAGRYGSNRALGGRSGDRHQRGAVTGEPVFAGEV